MLIAGMLGSARPVAAVHAAVVARRHGRGSVVARRQRRGIFDAFFAARARSPKSPSPLVGPEFVPFAVVAAGRADHAACACGPHGCQCQPKASGAARPCQRAGVDILKEGTAARGCRVGMRGARGGGGRRKGTSEAFECQRSPRWSKYLRLAARPAVSRSLKLSRAPPRRCCARLALLHTRAAGGRIVGAIGEVITSARAK